MTCLRQALVLQRMLRASGADAHLRIGVRKDAGALEAHAGVECDGRAMIEHRNTQDYFLPLTAVEPNQ